MKDKPYKGLTTSLAGRAFDLVRSGVPGLGLTRTDEDAVARNARRFLAESLGRLKGLPQKVGQILSMSAAPAGDDPGFALLRESGEPLPLPVVTNILEREWGRPWRKVLAQIEPRGRAASLGQVHRALLPNGDAVAVKVQYPGIAQAVEADLKLLGWLSIPLGGFGKPFDLEGYRTELMRDFGEELDYRHEAENQRRYVALASSMPSLVIPQVLPDLSTERVLVSRWEDGLTLEEVAQCWDMPARTKAARVFLDHALGIFRRGFVHADLHPGNYRFRLNAHDDVELVLYDFGCLFQADPPKRLALLRLIAITEANRVDDPFPLFLALGFRRDYLEPLAERLPAVCRVLFEPFILPGPYPIRRWALGERIGAILGEERWNFRIAAPPELIFLMRMFHGLIHGLRTLEADVPWKFALDPIRTELGPAMAALHLEEGARPERGFARLAKHLRIRVVREGAVRVQLTLPVHVIESIEDMLDGEVLAQIRAQKIDLHALVRRVRERGYQPQEVFMLRTGNKDIQVWLE